MKAKLIHIVSLDVPYPPDYGGVIDIFYRIKSLHQLGIKVILHCFEYGRGEAEELNQYCEQVHYYKRANNFTSIFNIKPFIVSSRHNNELLKNLSYDSIPILFEGLHTTALINHPQLRRRKRLVRMHNVEWMYYEAIAQNEEKQWKKLYYQLESFKLKKFERHISEATLLALSKKEFNYFNFKYKDVHYLPVFHPYDKVVSQTGTGDYLLYQGNLSVNENVNSIRFLLEQVNISQAILPLKIAGKNPTEELKQLLSNHPTVELISNPSHQHMDKLIANAQINLLPTFQPTGIKLKLLSALFRGRHCMVTDLMVTGTGLEPLCYCIDEPNEFLQQVNKLSKVNFTLSDIEKRSTLLNEQFNNINSAKQFIELLDYPHQ